MEIPTLGKNLLVMEEGHEHMYKDISYDIHRYRIPLLSKYAHAVWYDVLLSSVVVDSLKAFAHISMAEFWRGYNRTIDPMTQR